MAERELIDLQKQCIANLLSCVDNVALFLNEAEKEAEFSKLRSCVEEYCMLEARQCVAGEALEKAKAETDATNLESLQERFDLYLSEKAEGRCDRRNHPHLLELDKRIQDSGPEQAQNLDESDLAITETHEQCIDPITKRPILEPCKNTVCGHVYERETIMELISTRKQVKCPVVGCGNRAPLAHSQLAGDAALQRRLRHARAS